MSADPAVPAPSSSDRRTIAYVMSRFPRITETFVLYEILELLRRGVDVQIRPLILERPSVRHPEVEALMPRVRRHPFLSPAIIGANLHYLVRSPRRYLGTIARTLRMTAGSLNFMVGAVGVIPMAVLHAREMEKDGVRHVHAHFANHPALAAYVVHGLTGIPYSFTAHGSDLHVDQRGLDRKVAAARFAVMISDYNARVVEDVCGEGARAKLRIVRCGVDTELFRPAPRTAGATLRIACVAALRRVKGHEHLLAGLARLAERGVAFECDLVGDGPLRSALEGEIVEMGLADRVRLRGALPQPEVIGLLADADVAVLTSVVDAQGRREGIPVSLMEAMASGLPVVASRLSGIPELVEDEREGLLVPPGDGEAIARALERLATSPELRHALGAAGREKVEREYDLRRNAARLAELMTEGCQPSAVG